jgi:hypothetical protein
MLVAQLCAIALTRELTAGAGAFQMTRRGSSKRRVVADTAMIGPSRLGRPSPNANTEPMSHPTWNQRTEARTRVFMALTIRGDAQVVQPDLRTVWWSPMAYGRMLGVNSARWPVRWSRHSRQYFPPTVTGGPDDCNVNARTG